MTTELEVGGGRTTKKLLFCGFPKRKEEKTRETQRDDVEKDSGPLVYHKKSPIYQSKSHPFLRYA